VALILTVDEQAWRHNVERVRRTHPGLVPVVKGTGYGFGRRRLAAEAAAFGAPYVAVGTVHELDGLPPGPTPVVLTPTVRIEPGGVRGAVVTADAVAHLDAARRGAAAGIVVEVASSMHRYGVDRAGLAALVEAADRRSLPVVAVAIHLPLAGTSAERAAEAARWIPHLPAAVPLWCSHLDAGDEAGLAARHPVRQRIGTRLWLGDKAFCHLGAEVVSVHRVARGTPCGYRQHPAPADGHVVAVGAGTAQGVTLLPDGRSPLHHARRRLDLVEPPHQHTTLAFVPLGEPLPSVEEILDVQRPLTEVRPDEVVWR
jgi:alanine racemase